MHRRFIFKYIRRNKYKISFFAEKNSSVLNWRLWQGCFKLIRFLSTQILFFYEHYVFKSSKNKINYMLIICFVLFIFMLGAHSGISFVRNMSFGDVLAG